MNNNTDSLNHSRRIDRRTILSGLSGTLVALAGCSSSPSGESSTASPTESESDTFESVSMAETDLVVELTSDAEVETVNLINPNGELRARQRIQEGVIRVAFQLLGETEDGYTPGDYRVVAVNGEETVGETTLSLEPEVTITDVMWAQNHPNMDWDKDRSTWQQLAALTVENTGNAPTFLTRVQWTDAPLCRVHSQETMDYGHYMLLPPEETKTIYSSATIYQTEGRLGAGNRVDCSNLGSAPLTVTGITQAGTNPSYSQTIEYGGAEYSCELSIVDGGPTESTKITTTGSDT